MLTFGQRLKAIRNSVQLTQAELAEKLMMSVQSISKWECDNAMPDISQIVPLAAILGVTTDCLPGVGRDEKADREMLFEKAEKMKKGIDYVYSRNDDAYYECYELYKEHIKKYPLDYEVKFLCADSLIRHIYYGAGTVGLPHPRDAFASLLFCFRGGFCLEAKIYRAILYIPLTNVKKEL